MFLFWIIIFPSGFCCSVATTVRLSFLLSLMIQYRVCCFCCCEHVVIDQQFIKQMVFCRCAARGNIKTTMAAWHTWLCMSVFWSQAIRYSSSWYITIEFLCYTMMYLTKWQSYEQILLFYLLWCSATVMVAFFIDEFPNVLLSFHYRNSQSYALRERDDEKERRIRWIWWKTMMNKTKQKLMMMITLS